MVLKKTKDAELGAYFMVVARYIDMLDNMVAQRGKKNFLLWQTCNPCSNAMTRCTEDNRSHSRSRTCFFSMESSLQ
jgi:hypothetical protein